MRKTCMHDNAERRIVGTIHTDADIPTHFESRDAEVEFWETHDFSEEYIRTHRIPRDRFPFRRAQAQQQAPAQPPE